MTDGTISIITCIYYDLFGTSFNGTTNRKMHYILSLKNIAKSRLDIFCFCSINTIDYLREEFIDYTNVTFIPFDLNQHPLHDSICRIRNSDVDTYNKSNDWSSRCVEIMWGKFWFIKRVIESYPEFTHYYWVDAGLCHGGIINSQFHPRYPTSGYPKVEDAYSYEKLFEPDDTILHNITKIIDDKILNICTTIPLPKISKNGKSLYDASSDNVIGGLFGGIANRMLSYAENFINFCNIIIEHNILVKEEQIMTQLLLNNNDDFYILRFESWYHDDWERGGLKGYYDNTRINFSDIMFQLMQGSTVKFVTLAVGDDYIQKCVRLIKSMQSSEAFIYVLTDDPSLLRNYLTISELSRVYIMNSVHAGISVEKPFNYRNKLRTIIHMRKFIKYEDILFYIDCDCTYSDFNLDKLTDSIQSHGLYCAYRPSAVGASTYMTGLSDKLNSLKIMYPQYEDYILPFEVLLLVKYGENCEEFFKIMENICNFAEDNGIMSFCEAAELGLAATASNIPITRLSRNTHDMLGNIKTELKNGDIVNALFH